MSTNPLVSVIVPVWRDREALERLLGSITCRDAEVVVSVPYGDRSEYEGSVAPWPDVRLVEGPRGRASQMNAGAAVARGRWLLFLHADSRLPADWETVVRTADDHARAAAGAFRFALDSGDLRARMLELAVRLRVRLLRLPYGDQGIFVRKRAFEAVGGYADLPIMEDIDLVRRLRTRGSLFVAASPVVTAARRWERDGWLRRSAANVMLAAGFFLGVPPSRLAQRYFGRRASALVVMGRAPWRAGKSRLGIPDQRAHEALRHALFFDTLEAASAITRVDRLVACEPAGDVPALRAALEPGWDLIAQRGDSLGARMAHVFEDVFRLGYDAVVVVGSDLPDLPPGHVTAAYARLAGAHDAAVIGPADDGGYYLVGLTRPHPELFEQIDWGTAGVLEQTRAAAARARVNLLQVDAWSDVDSLNDLARVAERNSAGSGAPRTRAWLLDRGTPANPDRS